MKIEPKQQRQIANILLKNANEIAIAVAEGKESIECQEITISQAGLQDNEVSEGFINLTILVTGCYNIYIINKEGIVVDYEEA